MGSPGFTWVHLGSLGFTWVNLGSLGFTLVYLGSLVGPGRLGIKLVIWEAQEMFKQTDTRRENFSDALRSYWI